MAYYNSLAIFIPQMYVKMNLFTILYIIFININASISFIDRYILFFLVY